MKKILISIVITVIFGNLACTFSVNKSANNSEPAKNDAPKAETKTADTKKDEAEKTADKKDAPEKSSGDKSACLTAKMDGKKLIKDQTFVFDHEPFPKSCFVTFASKEEMVDDTDVPRGSTFHIYKDGKIVYDFPDAFDEMPACWVEAVGFEDLNGDNKIEVIIAGKCLGNKDSYPMNAVYENHNDDFRTFRSQNEKLDNLKTVRQIIDYVKKNRNQFFDN